VSDGIQEFFGLHRRPFDKDVPDEALWLNDGRKDAMDRLVDAVTARQHALVLGEPGVGKNCVLRGLRSRLSPVHFRLTYVAHVALAKRDFYRQVCFALGIECKLLSSSLYAAIQKNIVAIAAERIHPVLVLDEAHLMPDDSLGTLHILANFDWDREPILSLVLVGLPELGERLKLGLYRSLLTRVNHKIEITPATPEDTGNYVRKRLSDAGARSDLFAPDALVVLHELTGGVLRSVDILADATLRVAVHRKLKIIDRAVVRSAFPLTPLA
jgi:type II secretory pathway predicted ATPase ExeA